MWLHLSTYGTVVFRNRGNFTLQKNCLRMRRVLDLDDIVDLDRTPPKSSSAAIGSWMRGIKSSAAKETSVGRESPGGGSPGSARPLTPPSSSKMVALQMEKAQRVAAAQTRFAQLCLGDRDAVRAELDEAHLRAEKMRLDAQAARKEARLDRALAAECQAQIEALERSVSATRRASSSASSRLSTAQDAVLIADSAMATLRAALEAKILAANEASDIVQRESARLKALNENQAMRLHLLSKRAANQAAELRRRETMRAPVPSAAARRQREVGPPAVERVLVQQSERVFHLLAHGLATVNKPEIFNLVALYMMVIEDEDGTSADVEDGQASALKANHIMDAFDVDAGIGCAEFTARLCRTDVWSTQTMRKLESLAAEAADELQLDQGGGAGGHAAAAAASIAASNDLQATLDQLTRSKQEHAAQLERQADRHAEEMAELRRALQDAQIAGATGAGRGSPRARSPSPVRDRNAPAQGVEVGAPEEADAISRLTTRHIESQPGYEAPRRAAARDSMPPPQGPPPQGRDSMLPPPAYRDSDPNIAYFGGGRESVAPEAMPTPMGMDDASMHMIDEEEEEAGPQLEEDGSEVQVMEDGTEIRQWPDGRVRQTLPDGMVIERLPDGTQIQSAVDGTRVTQSPDGTLLQEFPDGSSMQQFADGSVRQLLADKSVIEQAPDGSRKQEWPDGRVHQLHVDGSTMVRGIDGSQTHTTTDGHRVTKFVDGSILSEDLETNTSMREWPDGRVQQRLEDGSLIERTADGEMRHVDEEVGETDGGSQQQQQVEEKEDDDLPPPNHARAESMPPPDWNEDEEDEDGEGEGDIQPDGSRIVEHADGSVVQHWPNGRVQQVLADGTVIERLPDGSQMQTGTDGVRITQYVDGRVRQEAADGVVIEQHPDGTFRQTMPDGSAIEQAPDGTRTAIAPDGTQTQA